MTAKFSSETAASPEVRRFSSTEAMVREVADRWLDFISQRPVTSVALSGGRISSALFLAFAHRAKQAPPGQHLFWADERCVPPESNDSNFKLASETLISPLSIPPTNVHRIRGELGRFKAAHEATTDLANFLQTQNATSLDLVLLGMGEDGHVASLFPPAPANALHDRDLYLPMIGPKPPPERVTLSYRALTAATEVWVVISSAGKEKALGAALKGDETLPLGKLLRCRKHTTLFNDLTST